MKTISKILGIVIFGAAVSATAAPYPNQFSTSKGLGATVESLVTTGDTSGPDWTVVDTNVSIYNSTDRTNSGGAGGPEVSTTATMLSVSIRVVKSTGGSLEFLDLSGQKELASGYTLSLPSASLAPTTIDVQGVDGNGQLVTHTISVTGSWSATTKLGKTSYTCNDSGSYKLMTDQSSLTYNATFSGQALDGGTDLLGTTPAYSSIGSFSFSSTVIH